MSSATDAAKPKETRFSAKHEIYKSTKNTHTKAKKIPAESTQAEYIYKTSKPRETQKSAKKSKTKNTTTSYSSKSVPGTIIHAYTYINSDINSTIYQQTNNNRVTLVMHEKQTKTNEQTNGYMCTHLPVYTKPASRVQYTQQGTPRGRLPRALATHPRYSVMNEFASNPFGSLQITPVPFGWQWK